MGASFSNVYVRGNDQAPALAAVRELARLGRNFFVSPAVNGWVAIYPEEQLWSASVARPLAEQLNGDLLHVSLLHDDVFSYDCYRTGRLYDRFCSTPDYFEAVSGRVKSRLRGSPERLADVIGAPAMIGELREVLDLMRTEPLFVTDALDRFAKLLGLSNLIATYEEFCGAMASLAKDDGFTHVCDPARSIQSQIARADQNDFVRRLVTDGWQEETGP